ETCLAAYPRLPRDPNARAKGAQHALLAAREDGPADVLSPCDQIKIDVRPEPRRRRAVERLLRFVGRARPDPSQAVRNPVNVSVDTDVPPASKRQNQDEIGCLSSDSR